MTMGSLPNLHELCNKEDQANQLLQKISQCHGQHEKSKIFMNNIKILGGHQKIQKSRSNGHTTHICDDMLLEQMATYSPISSRSTRNLTHNTIRRRDSMNSSIGATSIRRLITVVRNTHGRYGPVYSKKLLIRNLIVLCISHILISVTFYPFLALQSSVSVWYYPLQNSNSFIPSNINIGSLLIALSYLFAAFSTLLGPSFVQRFGTNAVLFTFCITLIIFYTSHFYPVLFLLVPVYVMFGLALGLACVGRATFLMNVSSKLNCVLSEDDEDQKNLRKTCVIRRVARSFQAAQDIGFIIGSILTALVIVYTFDAQNFVLDTRDNSTQITNQTLTDTFKCTNCTNLHMQCRDNCTLTCTESYDSRNCSCHSETNETCRFEIGGNLSDDYTSYIVDYSTFMDSIFDVDETGGRLCGSKACPSYYKVSFNFTGRDSMKVLSPNTADILTGIFVAFSLIGFLVAVMGLDRIRLFIPQDPLERPEGLAALKSVRETFKDFKLQLAAPLAVFVGLEQAFMFADFSKSYVVCTLGIERLNLVFLCMGLLQSIAACTLSMLLRSIQRYIVIAVGFTFHACLLMVQSLWKPSGDDPALFYVISAAWGVCNAIWEMLIFTLLTGAYTDNWQSAYANSFFFRHIGLAFAFAVHGLLCNWIKLYFLAAFMVMATVPFTWLEIKLENIRKVQNISRL